MSRDHPQPSISIAMGTYNGAAFLPEQLASLLAQQVAPFELVVGDDGSTDGTLAILEQFASRAPFPVHVSSNPRQLGFGENFLQAATRCTGEWVAFCDQDDWWHPAKIARCAPAIAAGPADLALVVHSAIVGDEALVTVGRLDSPSGGLYPRLSLPPDWVAQGFRQIVRRSLLDRVPFADRSLSWHVYPDAHDTWTCLMASVTGSILVLDDPLVTYRRHDSNATEGDVLAAPSLATRVRGMVRGNSAHHRDIALVYRKIALYLAERGAARLAPPLPELFRSASAEIAAYSDRLELRSRISRRSGLGGRLRAFVTLARSGAYANRGRWRFGTQSAVKDLVNVIVPGSGEIDAGFCRR